MAALLRWSDRYLVWVRRAGSRRLVLMKRAGVSAKVLDTRKLALKVY